MKRALILFGAGASVEFKTPSTSGLTSLIEAEVLADNLMRKVGGDVAFTTIKSGLAAYLQNSANINFEQIYHCAHELLFTFPPSHGAADEFRPVMQPFMSNTTSITENSLQLLCSKMVEIIIREVSSSCGSNPLSLDPLSRFIENLRANYATRIYTTNYDDFPLQAAPDLYIGFLPPPEPRKFDINGFWRKERRDTIFHLHGSVHFGFLRPPKGEIGELGWYDDRLEALKYSSFSGSSPRRMDGTSVLRTAIVTGLEKLSRVQQQPFSYFYAMMARDAMRADVIFVLGSGLADLHLNTWLAEARLRNPQPPILFVDFWQNGFEEDAYFEIDPKIIALFHRLRVHISGDNPGTRIGDWLLSKDRSAAIWDKGFQAFLNAPDQLRTILTSLKGKHITSPVHRSIRRLYRSWT